MRNTKFFLGVALAIVAFSGLALLGCQGKNNSLAPTKVRAALLKVKVPGRGIRAALLGASQNELIYRLDSFWFSPIENTIGPFTTPAADGEVDFDVDMPVADDIVLSIQLNDAATHQPLALGATGIDLVNFPTSDVIVDMGSVTRNCYYTQSFPMPSGGSYNFGTDVLANSLPATTGIADIAILPVPLGAPATFQDAQNGPPGNTITYLGNGNLVDFDYVPADFYFYPDSFQAKGADLQTGDVFCIAISSIPATFPPTYAWIQITDPGGTAQAGPSFIFRVNSDFFYYAYQQTPIDLSSLGTCNMGW